MQQPYDDLYHDRTCFDALGDWLMQRAQRLLPRSRARLWTMGFAAFAALCVAWAAGLATQAVLFEAAWNQRAAELLAAGLLLIAARHFLAVTGLSARPVRKLITRPVPQAAVPASQASAPRTVQRAVDQKPPAATVAEKHQDSQIFFRELRASGVNVRIAQVLYAAGFRSAQQVRASSDAEILAIPGVGQATLRKLRLQSGLPQAEQPVQSNAA